MNYEKEIEVLGKYDVVVAGAGPAGICAAVAAARQGKKVALIERYGTIGGNLTIGCVRSQKEPCMMKSVIFWEYRIVSMEATRCRIWKTPRVFYWTL